MKITEREVIRELEYALKFALQELISCNGMIATPKRGNLFKLKFESIRVGKAALQYAENHREKS